MGKVLRGFVMFGDVMLHNHILPFCHLAFSSFVFHSRLVFRSVALLSFFEIFSCLFMMLLLLLLFSIVSLVLRSFVHSCVSFVFF